MGLRGLVKLIVDGKLAVEIDLSNTDVKLSSRTMYVEIWGLYVTILCWIAINQIFYRLQCGAPTFFASQRLFVCNPAWARTVPFLGLLVTAVFETLMVGLPVVGIVSICWSAT
jgi:hypothetical protein